MSQHANPDRLFGGQAKSVSFYDYMHFCLTDAECGYYRTYPNGATLGANGDFTTAPEISQIFGDCIGFWLLDLWHRSGQPNRFNLIELGPGRGVLMRDILHVLRQHGSVWDSLHVYLLDISPHLQEVQRQILSPFADKIDWVSDFTALPYGDSLNIVIANEFFDALAVRQFIWSESGGGGWHERRVELTENRDLRYAVAEQSDSEALALEMSLRDGTIPIEGDIFEYAPEAIVIMQYIGKLVGEYGGALIVDYGYAGHAFGDSVQAVRRHESVPLLGDYSRLMDAQAMPDLSAHVRFRLLEKHACEAGLRSVPLMSQSDFLRSMASELRLQKLLQTCTNTQQKQALRSGYQRISDSEQMGQLFKVLTLYGKMLAG